MIQNQITENLDVEQ